MPETNRDNDASRKRNQETSMQARKAIKEAQTLALRLNSLMDVLESLVIPANDLVTHADKGAPGAN